MGGCLSWFPWLRRQKLIRPTINSTQHPQAHVVQFRVLEFVYHSLCEVPPIEGLYCVGFVEPEAGWRCLNCGVFQTYHDFTIKYGPFKKVQFQIPLCEECQPPNIVRSRIYDPSNTFFRSFYNLSIVLDLLEIHRFFVESHRKSIELVEVELVAVS